MLIPVLVDIQTSQISLFENNVFYDFWNFHQERFYLLNYILPTEDLEDVNLLLENKKSIEDYDFKKTIAKYDLKDFIIIVIYKNKNDLKVLSKIKINDYLKIENQTFQDVNIKNDEVLKKILTKLKNIYENHWKSINKINTSIKLPLTVSLASSEYEKILKFENVLSKLDLIFSYDILSFDNNKIYYKIIYNGAPNKFIDSLEENNIDLDTQKQEWKVK